MRSESFEWLKTRDGEVAKDCKTTSYTNRMAPRQLSLNSRKHAVWKVVEYVSEYIFLQDKSFLIRVFIVFWED